MSFKNIGKVFKATNTNELIDALKNIDTLGKAANIIDGLDLDKASKEFALSKAFNLDVEEIRNLTSLSDGISDVTSVSQVAKKELNELKTASTGLFGLAKNFVQTHPILLAVSALTAAFATVSAMTTDAKEKVDKAVSSSEKYEQTKSDIQSIESELETVGNQIDELNAKDHLSFTDQAELSNLQTQSAELERQLELKQALADIQQDQAARDAKDAFNAHSMRDTVNDNEDGFFNTIKTTYQKAYAWVHDKLGMSESNQDILLGVPFSDTTGLKTADGTLLDRIQQAQKAANDLKDLQKSQTADNYDKGWIYRKWCDGTVELWWNSNVTYSNSVGAGVTGLTLVSVDIPLPFTISNGMAMASATWYFSEWAQASINTKSATHVTVRKFGNENSQNLPVQGVYIYVRGTI